MSELEEQYYNEVGPVANSDSTLGTRAIHVTQASDTTVTSVDLASVFNKPTDGYYVVQACDSRFYFALSQFAQSIDETATGTAAGGCMLLAADALSSRFRIPSGPHPTIAGTLADFTTMNLKSTTGTGTFRIIRKGLQTVDLFIELHRDGPEKPELRGHSESGILLFRALGQIPDAVPHGAHRFQGSFMVEVVDHSGNGVGVRLRRWFPHRGVP